MSTRDKKRVMKAAKQAVTGSTNPLVSNCHDYTTSVGQLSLMPSEDDFPSYPATPCKPPASKKALLRDDCAGSTSNSDIVDTLSTLINARSDAIEKMVGENTMKIEGLKMTIDFACREIKDVKKRVENMEKCVKKEEEEVVHLKVRVTELENYSRRWNLKLFGIPESIVDVKIESIQICQAILPQDQNKVAEAIDIVHRLGKRQPGVSKPRGVILRFLSRTYRDAAVKEIRAKLWPAIQKARSEGKSAYFVGARAFIGGVELRLQQNEEGQRKAIGDEDNMS
ncbi:hypothetical protein F2P79_019917 [Pimephales promelas]|nr:hypothetical protein F2P79_019917 [Pimephales promelas]